ncbi:zinc finger protein with KRAB and SCAN domains 1-like isoform X6 [Lineus longissimus]|uniref:zinc finger protein with KRAB and SCAN domains 1-like isoform X6 n=1 Tax=Lineus longissimus TaxID=88925 RepID=UPI00315CF34C
MMMESSENSIMSEVTDHVPVLLKDIPPSSSPQTVDDPLKVMQNDLHSRGTDLSKAWTSLFSLLTKYQAELTVKENQIDIAERQLETRKQQLSMLNDQVVSPDDTSKLQEQLNQKELVLSRCQQELTNTSDMLNRVQSDLSSHMQQLERARHEQLQNHEKLLNYQSEITKLKSELMLKQEEIHIKDNLVQKLQNQLVRETSDLNAEISRLKENIESHVRVLDNERRSHEQTRKSVRSLQQNKSRIGGTVQQNVIEIPDSPPTLDLSVEQHDFGLSNIISLSEQQPMEQESHSAQFRHHPYRQETVRTPPMTLSSPTQRSPVNKLGNIHSDITDRWRSSASATAASQSVSSTASDTFFPLSTSAMDASIEQQNLNIKQEPALSGSVPISGPIPGGSSSQGHQSSNDSDTGQSQFNVDAIATRVLEEMDGSCTTGYIGNPPFPPDLNQPMQSPPWGHGNRVSSDMPSPPRPWSTGSSVNSSCSYSGRSPGSVNRSPDIRSPLPWNSGIASKTSPDLSVPNHTCKYCGKSYTVHHHLVRHLRIHTGSSNFECCHCGQAFTHQHVLANHIRIHTGEKPFMCSLCGKRFTQNAGLRYHRLHVCKAPMPQ